MHHGHPTGGWHLIDKLLGAILYAVCCSILPTCITPDLRTSVDLYAAMLRRMHLWIDVG